MALLSFKGVVVGIFVSFFINLFVSPLRHIVYEFPCPIKFYNTIVLNNVEIFGCEILNGLPLLDVFTSIIVGSKADTHYA